MTGSASVYPPEPPLTVPVLLEAEPVLRQGLD